MRVLIVGSGGREHCLAWKISQSPLVDTIYCAPGNGGTAAFSHNVDIPPTDINRLLEFALEKKMDLTVVGPEAPLVEGIVDKFTQRGLKIFGPRKEAASLEGSKVFAKEVMNKYHIPTAGFEAFDNYQKAREYVRSKGAPLVVKAEGLAAGKGVIVCRTSPEAIEAIESIMVEKKFAQAGERVVIEDYLPGEEASLLAFTDGEAVASLVSSQDHKPVDNDDQGKNTGGMGAYAPAPLVSEEISYKVTNQIFLPLIEGLKKEGRTYKGMLYAGLMIKDSDPYVLEFNVRFGDPETQAIIPKLKSDLVEIMLKTIEGKLAEVKLEWDERFCLCVVLASGGYPDKYEKGKEISGLEELAKQEDVFVFHAGTKRAASSKPQAPRFLTNGGRVLNVVAMAPTLRQAQKKAYEAVESIYFEKMHYRSDIGNKAGKLLV